MTDTDMLYMSAQAKRIEELETENKVLMSEADRLIKEKGQLLKVNEDMKNLLRETQPVLRRAFFANYKDTNAANELYDKINKMIWKGEK